MEQAYRERGQPAIARVTSLPGDAELDASLAALGYSPEGATLVLWRNLEADQPGPELEAPPIDAWLEDFAVCSPERGRDHDASNAAILARREGPAICGRLQHNGSLAVGTACLFDGVMDIAVQGSTIARVGRDIPAAQAKKTIDAAGAVVTPGLIDLHAPELGY